MLKEQIIDACMQSGFDEYREVSTKDIIFSEVVFDQCAVNTCGSYGKNYACPPLSGSLEENKARMLKYENSILINKLVKFKHSRNSMKECKDELDTALNKLRELTKDLPVMIAIAGGCDVCAKCAALTGDPCRFPDKVRYSLEGSGIDVCKMSMNLKMKYNAGGGVLGFFYLVLY